MSALEEAERSYIPALGKRWLLPLYDPFLWLLGADKAKRLLIEQAGIKSGFRVLDIGCGTGSLAILIKPGTGTGITTLTLPTGCRTITGSGCCRQARSRQTDPTALAAQVVPVRIDSGWTNAFNRSCLHGAAHC